MNSRAKASKNLGTIFSLLLITLVAVLAYGIMIPRLGFYRDDWYMIWSAQAQGAEGLIALFKIDRPFIGYLYAFDYALLGASPLNWHIYAFLVKLLGGFALYWLLRLLWPEKRTSATFATLLFIVYPGFYQQPNAALFINLLCSHAAAILSLALTIHALKARSPWVQISSTLLAIVLALFYLIIYEAMIGLEVARLILLVYAIHKADLAGAWKAKVRRALKWAFPYLVLAAAFTYWRIFVFESGRRSTNASILWEQFSTAPARGGLAILIETAKDLFDNVVFAWTVPLYQNVTYSEYRDLGASLFLAALAIGLAGAFYYWANRRIEVDSNSAQSSGAYVHMLGLGLLVVLVTALPIVVAGRDVSFSYQWDRYTVQSSLGVALVMIGIAFSAVRPPARGIFLLALLGSGVITQYQAAVYYRELWTQERELWWQLSWRVPDLQPGATLIAAPPAGYRFLEEYEVWGPLNIIYNPGSPVVISGQVPYEGIELGLAEGTRQNRKMRGVLVVHDYSMPLIVSKPTLNSCVHVIDGKRLELPYGEDPRVEAIAPYSQAGLILPDAPPKTPPEEVFGHEPDHAWCYYYEKIDLARQVGDWERAAELAAEVERLGIAPADRSEWLPLIEAHVNSGELDRARELARKLKDDKNLRLTLCEQLNRTTSWPDSTDFPALVRIICGGDE